MQGLDHDSSRRASQRDNALEQFIEQLIGELTHKVTFPVMPLFTISGVDDALLIEKGMLAQIIFDESGRGAQAAQFLRIFLRACVAGEDLENRRQ